MSSSDIIPKRMREWAVQRISSDKLQGFPFLRRVPAAETRMFADYYQHSPTDQFQEYVNSIPLPALWDEPDLRPLQLSEFEKYKDNAARLWTNRPPSIKRSMGLLLRSTNQLPGHMVLPDDKVTREEIAAWADYKAPSRKQILSALEKQFSVECRESEANGGEYLVSKNAGRSIGQTLVVIALNGSVVSYYHRLEDNTGTVSHPFTLIGHAIDWTATNWNLVTKDNLDKSIGLLSDIVIDFETMFKNTKMDEQEGDTSTQ